jgi:hypothetical protein
MRPARLRLFGLAIFGSALAAAGEAQTTGQIEGVVRDSTGGVLPGVSVLATSPSLQGQRTFVADREGRFRFPAVPPGFYSVTATHPGFRPASESATVSLGSTATVSLTLDPEVQELVAVTGAAPPIDQVSTTTGTSYTDKVVAQLPVSRNYADIVKANPGVLSDKGQTQGRSLALSIYGATSAENQWIIDGVNTTNVSKGTQGKAINNEFVQEVEVKTGGYQAEYGGALGGIINVITKSGGNTFHGDAFFYYDSDATQAVREFDPAVDSDLSGMRLASYNRYDYGVDLGGYLIKDRLWFFGAYDRVEFPAQVSRYVSIPEVPNTMLFPLEGTDNLYSGKLTWNIGSGSTLVGTIFGDPTTNSGAGYADPRQGSVAVQEIFNPDPATWQFSRSIGGTDYGLRLNQILGTSGLATLQVARHQDSYLLVPTDAGLAVRFEDRRCEGGTPDEPCFSPGPVAVEGGLGLIDGRDNRSESLRDQIGGNLTFYRGDHEVKLGGGYQKGRTDATSYYTGGQRVQLRNEFGQEYYRHSFFAKSPDDLTPVDAPAAAAVRDFGAYVQDTWRVASNVTLNAGLRFDRNWALNFAGNTVVDLRYWQPRVGFVWDPTCDGGTKVYGFVGRFSYTIPTAMAIKAYIGFNQAATYNFDRESLEQDPGVLNHEEAETFFSTLGVQSDSDIQGWSTNELTFGVERLLDPSFTVGLKGTYRDLRSALEERCDFDGELIDPCWLVTPGSEGQYAQGEAPWCTALDEFNECFATGPATPPAKRQYAGLELLARKTISNRFWVQFSYTLSSLRGNYDGAVGENILGQTDPGLNVDFDYAQMSHNGYGRLFLDRPHQARLDGYYVLPFGLSVGLQSWIRSGPPLNRYGYFNFFYGSVIQLDPRGSAGRMPAEWDANLTLAYPIRIGPVTATLQGYVFNVFNNQIRTDQDMVWAAERPADYPDSLFDPTQPQSNPNYGKIVTRSDPRLFRAAVRISF